MSISDIQLMCFIPVSEKVISNASLQQILPGSNYHDIVLIITEFNLRFFIKSTTQLGYKEFDCRPYSNLFLIDSIDNITFRLVFSTNNSNQNRYDGKNIVIYTLIKENSNTIIDHIYNAAKKVLPSHNYLRINRKIKENFNKNEETTSYDAFIHRYRALLAWKKIFPPQISLQKLRAYLQTNPTAIDIEALMELNFDIESFIRASDVYQTLNSIILPGDKKSTILYDILKKVLFLCPHIEKITIKNDVDQYFYNFLKFLNKQTKISIKSIQFQDCQITAPLIKSIQIFLLKHKIELSFVDCDLSQNLNKLLSIENLTHLNLNSNLSFKIENIPQMPNLTHLSLNGCGFDISSLLCSLKEKVPNIEYLDLSKNECLSEFSQNISIPNTLSELFLSRINWTPFNFTAVFKSCCQSKQPISLSLADPIFNSRRDSFCLFYENFKEILSIENPSLRALYWNHNRIRSVLLKFLLRCKNLQFVSFSGCKINKHVIRALKKFVENHISLQIIDLHGSIRVTFNDVLPQLFRWLKKSKSVTKIDVSKNKLNDRCITSLSDLIMTNSKIRQILIDDLDINDYSSMSPLINAIKSRKDQISIQFPEETFSELQEKGQIDDQNLNNIRSLFKNPVAQNNMDCELHWKLLIRNHYPEWPNINQVSK